MDGIDALLADLGKATGIPSEPSSPRRPSHVGINAASARNRRLRNSSFLTTPSKSSIIAQASRVSPRRPSIARSLSLLSSHQHGSEGSIKQSRDLLETVQSAARERWRGLDARLPARKPSVQAPITDGKPDIQSGRARGGSRFAQLVQQVTVPSWMQGHATPSAPRALAHTHGTPRMDAASDLLSQINASMTGPPHSSTGAQSVKGSSAGDILAMLEASLQPPNPQHAVPSVFRYSGTYLAADELTEINKLLSTPVSSGRQVAQPAAPYHQDVVSNSTMQQLSLRHNSPERHSPVHSPTQVYGEAQPAQRLPMKQESGSTLDTSAYDLSQHEFIGQPLPDDHRHQHINALLQRSLLEPASLSDLRAAWSRRPVSDPQSSTLRFKEEAARFLNSLDAWAQAEDQARQTYAANMQRLYA